MTISTSRTSRRLALVLCAVTLGIQPQLANAYIDPNTGGLIFQLVAPLLAMIASAWLMARDAIRSMWRRAVGLVFPQRAIPAEPGAAKDAK